MPIDAVPGARFGFQEPLQLCGRDRQMSRGGLQVILAVIEYVERLGQQRGVVFMILIRSKAATVATQFPAL